MGGLDFLADRDDVPLAAIRTSAIAAPIPPPAPSSGLTPRWAPGLQPPFNRGDPVLVANQNHGRVGMEAWHDRVGIIRAALCVWYSYSHIFLLRRYAAGRVH
jgi:hypothetical protein